MNPECRNLTDDSHDSNPLLWQLYRVRCPIGTLAMHLIAYYNQMHVAVQRTVGSTYRSQLSSHAFRTVITSYVIISYTMTLTVELCALLEKRERERNYPISCNAVGCAALQC